VHGIILAGMIFRALNSCHHRKLLMCYPNDVKIFLQVLTYFIKMLLCSNMIENNKLNLARFWVSWKCLHIHRGYTNF